MDKLLDVVDAEDQFLDNRRLSKPRIRMRIPSRRRGQHLVIPQGQHRAVGGEEVPRRTYGLQEVGVLGRSTRRDIKMSQLRIPLRLLRN